MATVDVEPQTIDELVRKWIEEIDLSREREKDWRKDGREAEEIYEAKELTKSFNILHSNTETLAPSLYGQIPRPVIQRRFKDPDPLGRSVSTAGQRVLEYLLDTNSEEYETFDESIKDAVLDALLPGRGLTEFCYHAETAEVESSTQLVSECVYPKSVVWSRFYHGYAKRWTDVPWCAIELYLDKAAITAQFGKETADKCQYSYEGSENQDKKDEHKANEEKTKTKTACIYKIWDKKKRQIVWVSPNHPTSILRTDEDELGLTGFYPFPKPLRFMRKSNNLMPTTVYRIYKTQAEELNTISKRLIHLISACKVRGIYDSTIGEVEEVLKAEENTLIPAEQVAGLQNTKGLEGAIWLMPIEQIITVVKELYLAREQCKMVIYEITGISDIVRGQSNAGETLGAQKIKETWVTLRLKNMQKEVQRYVRDSLRIMLDIAAKQFQPDTWVKMTGLPFATDEELAQMQQITMGAQQAGQQPPPEVVAKLQGPKWSEILDVMKDDMSRQYKVDIETNSTLDVEAAEDKEHIADLMNAISQFLNGVGPLVEKGMLPFQAAQAMLMAITKKFRFGTEVEEYIQAMKEPKPQDDGKAAQAQMDAQQKEKDRALTAQTEQQKAQAAERALQAKVQGEEAQRQHDAMVKAQELAAEEAADIRRIAAEREANLAKLASERATAKMVAELEQETELKKASLAGVVALKTAQLSSQTKLTEVGAKATVDMEKLDTEAELAREGQQLEAEANDREAEAKRQQAEKEAKAQKEKDEREAKEKERERKAAEKEAKEEKRERERAAKDDKSNQMLVTMIQGIMETQRQLIDLVGADKELVRDEKGKAKGVRTVRKSKENR